MPKQYSICLKTILFFFSFFLTYTFSYAQNYNVLTIKYTNMSDSRSTDEHTVSAKTLLENYLTNSAKLDIIETNYDTDFANGSFPKDVDFYIKATITPIHGGEIKMSIKFYCCNETSKLKGSVFTITFRNNGEWTTYTTQETIIKDEVQKMINTGVFAKVSVRCPCTFKVPVPPDTTAVTLAQVQKFSSKVSEIFTEFDKNSHFWINHLPHQIQQEQKNKLNEVIDVYLDVVTPLIGKMKTDCDLIESSLDLLNRCKTISSQINTPFDLKQKNNKIDKNIKNLENYKVGCSN